MEVAVAGTGAEVRGCETPGCYRPAAPGARLCHACRKSLVRRGRPSPGSPLEPARARLKAAAILLGSVDTGEEFDAEFRAAERAFDQAFVAACREALLAGDLDVAELLSPNARRIRRR